MAGNNEVLIVGGGLAGCEAAYQLSRAGIRVELREMRPEKSSPAHHTGGLAELVCSNSFRSNNVENAVGLIKEEMRRVGSLILQAAEESAVPAGDALAMDREKFSDYVTGAIESNPLIRVVREEVTEIGPERPTIIATGPLTSDALAGWIAGVTGVDRLYFYDAIAPIVDADSVDMDKAFAQSRYNKGEGADYVNCPLNEREYFRFIEALVGAEKAPLADFEKARYFPGCLPIEVIAESGPLSAAYGPMKPVGLVDPRTGERPFAVVQLRHENRNGTAYNLVGFQTKLKYPEQRRVFGMIPGLEQAEFLRFGSVHRNTYIHGPALLDGTLRLKLANHVQFAGQITGVEGYVESTACGMLAGLLLAARLRGVEFELPPVVTALGALLAHVTTDDSVNYQPTNINYSLFPPLGQRMKKREKRRAYSERALSHLNEWLPQVAALRDGANTRVTAQAVL